MVFCRHKYKVIKVDHFLDISFGGKMIQSRIYKRCTKCHKIKVSCIDGKWEMEDLLD